MGSGLEQRANWHRAEVRTVGSLTQPTALELAAGQLLQPSGISCWQSFMPPRKAGETPLRC